MTLKIEQGVPVPPPGAARRKYPFRRMEPGESFVVPLDGDDPGDVQRRLHGSAHRAGVRIRTRTVGEGVRVWLVSETREAA